MYPLAIFLGKVFFRLSPELLVFLSDSFPSWNHQQPSPPPLICPCLSQWDSGHLLALWKAQPSVPPPTETMGSKAIQPRKWFYALHTCEELWKGRGRGQEAGGVVINTTGLRSSNYQPFNEDTFILQSPLVLHPLIPPFQFYPSFPTITTACHSLPPSFIITSFHPSLSSCFYPQDKIIQL